MYKPAILSHNLLHNAQITADSEETGYEAWRLKDGKLHTYWKAETAATHEIIIKTKNMINNNDFEIDLTDWALYESGGGFGTLTRNTVAPIQGDGDAKLDATTANNTNQIVMMISKTSYRLKAGRTYRFSFVARGGAVNSKIQYGYAIIDDLLGLPEIYASESKIDLGVAATEITGPIFTPEENIDCHIFFRALEINTFWIDEIHLSEVRYNDTLVFPKGHNLLGYQMSLFYADTTSNSASFSPIFTKRIYSNESIYYIYSKTFYAPVYKIIFQRGIALGMYSNLPQEIPLIYWGKRWELDRDTYKFIDNFDSEFENRMETKVTSDQGLFHYTHRGNQKRFIRNIMPFGDDEYENVIKFFEDTENGMIPFGLSLRPCNESIEANTDLITYGNTYLMRLVGGRNVPYFDVGKRNWPFEAEEILGTRYI